MLDGYQFNYGGNNKTPYDFLIDARTGLRPNESKPPNMEMHVDLDRGTSGVTLPPKKIWQEGFWLTDWDEKALGKAPSMPFSTDEQNCWVAPGEGTPGNYKWRIYELPVEVAAEIEPRHPADWPKKLKSPSWSWRSDNSRGSSSTASSKSVQLPYGLRVCCQGCGHWFKMDDLTTHVQNCCPTTQGHAQWAIMCAAECGCKTLDEVVTIKDGYPKTAQPKDNGAVTSHKAETEG